MKDIMSRLNPGILQIKPYEPGKTVCEAKSERVGDDFIKMASNENPLGMSPRALAEIKNRAQEAFAYPEVTCRALREALSAKIGINPDRIIVGNGGDGIIYALALTLIAEGDEAIIPEITFPYYEIAVRAMRGRVVKTAMKGYELDLEKILEKINPHTKLIWVCNPNNPTGSVIARGEFMRFLEKVPDDVFVIHDEVYADFADKTDFPDTLPLVEAGRQNLFLIRSFSKIYGMAGVRVGYGVGWEQLVAAMYRVRPPFDISVLAQIAAVAALEDDEFYQATLAQNGEEKRFLCAALTRRGLPFAPTQTNFILIDVRRDGRSVVDALLERGVIVRPALGYNLPTHIRLTIGRRKENERFLKALDEALDR